MLDSDATVIDNLRNSTQQTYWLSKRNLILEMIMPDKENLKVLITLCVMDECLVTDIPLRSIKFQEHLKSIFFRMRHVPREMSPSSVTVIAGDGEELLITKYMGSILEKAERGFTDGNKFGTVFQTAFEFRFFIMELESRVRKSIELMLNRDSASEFSSMVNRTGNLPVSFRPRVEADRGAAAAAAAAPVATAAPKLGFYRDLFYQHQSNEKNLDRSGYPELSRT
jgi:hypothetical protein